MKGNHSHNKNHKGIVLDVILVLAIIGLLAAAGIILYNNLDPNHTVVIKQEVVQKDHHIDWDALMAKNPETVGWLTIEGTNIDTPIVQTTDNDKYLETGFSGEYNEQGVPFLDYEYHWDPRSQNSVIYGHSTLSTTIDYMFDQLLNYYDDPDMIYSHPTIEYRRPEQSGGDGVYEIFAVLAVEADYDYRQMDFESDETFVAYYDRIKADSVVSRSEIQITPGDEILTLSTCNRHAGLADGRTAVIARRKK